MAVTLEEILLGEARRDVVVGDLKGLIDAEVGRKKGASALAVKAGYGTVKKVSPTFVGEAINKLLPGFVARLEPFWQNFEASGEESFGGFLASRENEVSGALLGVTDERVEGSSRPTIRKVYSGLRPSAQKNVIEALPGLGQLVQNQAARV